ncbi:hypothetical protein FE633_44355 [Streptomyces montanus]|uniref:Uncharacterized protein n=1 Tax=Streptomyces montanus TaxID=2580423 RepID=A0A5R9FCJ6_9ACTN|nr:hypothetical protein FE633_44355 [Streptomyces montanus]
MPARFSLRSTSATIDETTSPAVAYARWRQHTKTASPTTAADGPVSTTYASEAGSPSGTSGPSRMPTRAYSVPASVAAYATSRVRRRPRQSSAIPNTTRICSSPPQAGRSSAGTKRDSGVRSRDSHRGSSARTPPTACTNPCPHGCVST